MLNKKILFLLYLSLKLTICLKSTDFCILKQQECKGFYDNQHKYHIKCESIKCHGTFNNDCGLKICSRNKFECNEYNHLRVYLKLFLKHEIINPFIWDKYLKERNKIQTFKKSLKECQPKIYKFKSNDFCLIGKNCTETRINNNITDCKCPNEQSFKCGQYCSKNSNACDSSKLNNNYFNISDCSDHRSLTTLNYNFETNNSFSIPFFALSLITFFIIFSFFLKKILCQ
jgi:hypothetical protein